jgi:hypothetical protein
MGSHIFLLASMWDVGSIRCTVHDIIISSVMCPNRFHVQDIKNQCLRLAAYGSKVNKFTAIVTMNDLMVSQKR